jgi:hypothetical protein
MPTALPSPPAQRPAALVVFLENVGHIHGIPLPAWATALIDFATEEYAKLLLRLLGAHRAYARIEILEDARATGPALVDALVDCSRAHVVDVLLLVHGHPGALVGYRGQVSVGAETFEPLLAASTRNPALLNLRMVYGVNCYGATLAPTWLALGAQVVNGAVGVNWLPEPSLAVFLRNWLAGRPYSQAHAASHRTALRWGRRVWRDLAPGQDHPRIAGSRQAIFGRRDVSLRG